MPPAERGVQRLFHGDSLTLPYGCRRRACSSEACNRSARGPWARPSTPCHSTSGWASSSTSSLRASSRCMQRRARTPDEQTGSQAGLPLTRVSLTVDRTYWYLDCICGMRLQLHEASQRSAHTQMLAVEEKAPKKARALT
eukprot:scaffold117462_cov57-Phaeocystis_antarctica.AAC.2